MYYPCFCWGGPQQHFALNITNGVSKEVPVGFKNIRLQFDLHSNATGEQTATLKKLTERYCVVYQTLVKGVEVETLFIN